MATNGYSVHSPHEPQRQVIGKGKYTENGREYSIWHRGKYLFPVDEIEMDWMDATHKFFSVARQLKLCGSHIVDLDNLSRAPRNPQILDLGCGTGIWTLDVAKKFWVGDKFIDGHVQGVDKCLDMEPANIYPNTSFTFLDIETQWTNIEPKHLIHARMLAGSIESWPQLYGEAIRHLIPGEGWFEQIEIDWDFCNKKTEVSPYLKRWAGLLLGATDQTARPLRIDRNRTIEALSGAGFVDIQEEVLHIRVNGGSRNPWEIDVGRWFNLSLHKGFMGLSLGPLTQVARPAWTLDDVETLREQVLREIGDRDNESFARLYIWSARRPLQPPHQAFQS